MRRSLVPSTRSGARALRSTQPSSNAALPFICASCRVKSQQTTSPSNPPRRRHLATTASRPSEASTNHNTQPQRESIVPQTHYDFFPSTFPNGPPPNSPFTPDLKHLRREFLQLQQKSHPDLVPQDRKRHAEALSMRLNEAYRAIQDPLSRARYLLSLRGIDVEDDSAKIEEGELLMEVMEVREAVDEAESEEELEPIRQENNARIARSVAILEQAFAGEDMGSAAEEAVRLRYWANIEESIQGWEKGVGGGLVHH